ncbi:uncharacterized protein P884DRAFT_321237 [Thermothelomyces heterothallicus CBS 202.75]|uniref:uncharacterized protein n=1 Tax=Thermothelomyces heterothallicus CBS 202.75 TaxID=1149848 RepID=UPI003742D4E0
MPEPYWNPANLLQIADSYTALKVQCLGCVKDSHAIRCRESLTGSDAAAVMTELGQMATIPPTKVTHHDLERLAKLCLCREHRISQYSQLSQNWKPAVAGAAKLHERLTKGQGNAATENSRWDSLLLERQKCFDLLGVQNEDADLAVELSAWLSSHENAKSMVSELQGDLAAANTSICTLEDCLRDLEAELHRARTRETELIQERHDAIRRIQETRKAEHSRLTGMLNLVKAASNDRRRFETLVTALREELRNARSRLEQEKANTRSLEQSEADLRRRLVEATEPSLQANSLSKVETAQTKILEGAKEELERRLSEAVQNLSSTRHLLEIEKAKAGALRDKQEDWECRLLNAYAEGDRLLAEEKSNGKALQKAKTDLERQLHEANVRSDRLVYEQHTKIKVLSSIKHELGLRLSEVRARSVAEANRFKRSYDALSKSHATALERARHLQASLDACRSRVRLLKDGRLSLESELRQCRAETYPLRTTNEHLRDEIEKLKSQVVTLEQALSKSWRSRLRIFASPHKPDHHTQDPLSGTMLNR